MNTNALYDTLIHVVAIGDYEFVVVIPAWGSEPIRIAFNDVPIVMQKHIRLDQLLMARVNLQARHHINLKISNWKLCPDPELEMA